MAPPSPLDQKTFSTSKPLTLGGKKILSVGAEVTLTADAQIIEALAANRRLPLESDPVRLFQTSLSVESGDRKVSFSSGQGETTFSAGGGVRAGLGVYISSQDMLNDIAALSGEGDQRIPLDEIPFPSVGAQRYYAFYWGYDVHGSATGSVALAPGAAVNFGAQGARNRGFAVIQAHEQNPNAGTAVRRLLNDAWQLPSQISSADDIEPGTWILAEVAGSFSANLGVQWGLDYNWVRSVKIDAAEVLEGDIGLKIQAGVNASFGVSASGRYVVIVGRESLDPQNKVLRVRLQRLQQRGWSMAFHANLDLTTSTGELLPKQLDDFIAATLGVHGLQTLQEVRRFADPSRRLRDLTSEFLTDYAREQLGQNFEDAVDEVHAKVTSWFDQWDNLPGKATSALWDAVRLPKAEVTEFVKQIKSFADPDQFEDALESALSDLSFTSTPAGKWLLGITEERLLSVVVNRPEAKRVRDAAELTLKLLDGKLLDELQTFVENKVGLPAIRERLKDLDMDGLTDLAKQRLAHFLGQNTPLDSAGLTKIRDMITLFDKRGGEFYAAGVKALNQTYKFSFDYAYSKSTTKTGLLDISFDFAANPDLSPLLERAIAGDFKAVLPGPGKPAPKGVTFHEAALTHHIQRQAHVKIQLPHFSQETIHTTSSLAGYRLASEEGGIYLYQLDAKDDVLRLGKWRSTLSMGLSLAVGASSEVRLHDRASGPTASMDYRFVQAIPNLQAVQFERFVSPLADLYFPAQFAGSGLAPADKPSVNQWAIALDKVVDAAEASVDGFIGNTLLSLDVSLPGDLLMKWAQAPADKKDPIYMEISRRFQTQLRRLIPLLYFVDSKNYNDLPVAQALMVWAALPVTTSIEIVRGQVLRDRNKRCFWDWHGDGAGSQRLALLELPETAVRLSQSMGQAAKVLGGTDDHEGKARFYMPTPINVGSALRVVRADHGRTLLDGLLFTEATLIESARDAGLAMAKFRANANDPVKAVEELAEFGDKIVRTFNSKLSSVFKSKEAGSQQLLRNLSLLIFAEITDALDAQSPAKPTAVLDVAVFRSDGVFDTDALLGGTAPNSDDLSVRQRIIEVGTLSS